MMPRLRRLLHRDGIRIPATTEMKDAIKSVRIEEPSKSSAKPEEAVKQEKPQELTKMSAEEHDEQELEEEEDDESDDEEQDEESEDESDEDSEDESATEKPEKVEKVEKVDKQEEVEKSAKPEKFTITKMMKIKAVREDGTFYMKTVPKGVGDVFVGEIPGKDYIEAILVPQYGGGEYSVINQTTKNVVKRYKFDGAAKDPDEPLPEAPQQVPPMAAIFQGMSAQPSQPGQQAAGQPLPQGGQPTLDRIQWAMAQGSIKAVEQLSQLAEKYADVGDTEKLNVVVGALKEIATGRKDATPTDRLTELLMADRQMMLSNILEGKKGKEASSSDIVRETMSTMKEMFSLAKEFAPGEDTGVQMVREVSGVVKDGLKEVTDTVIQVTGSKPLKQVEPPGPRYVYKCERCKAEVQPNYKACPSCGLVFRPGVITTPPPAPPPSPPVETFEKPAPPLPPEVRDKMSYLKKLAVFIQYEHDAATKGSAFFKQVDPESKLMLLFTANFGYNNIMKLVTPWRTSKEIPEGEAIFQVVESPNGRLWINTFFAAIKKAAQEENITLDEGTIQKCLDEINQYSPIKFSYKSKPKAPPPVSAPVPPSMKKVRGEEVAMSVCPVCDEQVPTLELKDHLFRKHPPIVQKPDKVNQRVKEAIAKGASVLPRGAGPSSVEELSEEPLAPNEQDDGTED